MDFLGEPHFARIKEIYLESAHPVGGIAPPPWDQAGMLSFMDDAGIDVAVTSISTPGVHVGDDARARGLARRCNELAASMIQKRPDRFGGFAALPLPDVDGALNELAYALDVLKLDGVVVFSNSNGVYLGDKGFEPVFEELERRGAVVFVHPTASPDPAAHQLGLPDTLIDFTADTGATTAELRSGHASQPGATVYSGSCANCHGFDAKGFGPYMPALAGNPVVLDNDPSSLINLVLNGSTPLVVEGTPAPYRMPQFRQQYSDQEIADVVTFIRNGWGNRAPAVTAPEVANLRKTTDPTSDQVIILKMR
ncbi:MAG: amidohydrolase family protein [Terriglobia bacterium]